MTNYTFTASSISVNGKDFPAEYSITPNQTVYAFVTVQEDGKPVNLRIKIAPEDPRYANALEAAQAAKDSREAAEQAEQPITEEQPEPVRKPRRKAGPHAMTEAERKKALAKIYAETTQMPEQQPTEAEQNAAEPEQPAEAEQNAAEPEQPAQEERPKVEKPWIGLEIKGRGWKIVFDGGHERTRVIFQRKPSKAAEEAVKAAGFFWSPTMESWNKKLTCKAFRAAQGLALQLKTICG